eukprot:GHVS01033623.1.p1 GENE.GHVS01033623.1~~GHVS01033623.1.p1  ORF type:complete len:169 (-),score=27.25 GHVS01033623.1:216-722(-)
MSVTGPRYNINAIKQLSETELQRNIPSESSWHRRYRESSYIFIGGLDVRLSEGDVVIVFSQWGEPVDVHLVRDKETGKSKGFGFLAYEDQRSTDLAVDNGNGMNLLGRNLRVDHALDYKPPEPEEEEEEGTKKERQHDGSATNTRYKASGAEGKGIGVCGILPSCKHL